MTIMILANDRSMMSASSHGEMTDKTENESSKIQRWC